MNDFMTTKEAAELWNISVRQVQNHCKNGRIKGLLKVGTNYLIPKDAVKPTYTYIYESNENTKKYVRFIGQGKCYHNYEGQGTAKSTER